MKAFICALFAVLVTGCATVQTTKETRVETTTKDGVTTTTTTTTTKGPTPAQTVYVAPAVHPWFWGLPYAYAPAYPVYGFGVSVCVHCGRRWR